MGLPRLARHGKGLLPAYGTRGKEYIILPPPSLPIARACPYSARPDKAVPAVPVVPAVGQVQERKALQASDTSARLIQTGKVRTLIPVL